MEKIQTAYALTRQAERCSASAVNASVKVKALVTKAQLESEEHQTLTAQRTLEEALRLSSSAHDDALIFMAMKTQVILAIAANDIPLALTAVDKLLAPGIYSPYPERLVRAKGLEYAVAVAAGLESPRVC
jgi:hypothetical protein